MPSSDMPSGTSPQSNGHTHANGNSSGRRGDWTYLKRHGFQREPTSIVIAGAGAAGICLGKLILEAQAGQRLGEIDLKIFERNEDYGGTWHANRYPGCRCDIPSHVYQFAFAPYSDWPEFYSSSRDINRYMHIVAQKYGVEPYIHCNRTITSAIYDESRAKWVLTVSHGGNDPETMEVDIFVSATGVLSQVNRPKIAGLENFDKSKLLHTAEWPKNLDFKTAFKDENVAVVGIGSSGLQTIGAIAPYTKSVSIFARSKFWMSPPMLTEPLGERDWSGGNFQYSENEKEEFRQNPKALYEHGAALTAESMHLFDIFFKGSPEQEKVKVVIREKMEKDLRYPELIKKLIPDFDVWCRRVTPCVPFMDAIHEPHVNLVTDPIKEITHEGVVTVADQTYKVDRIIFATGFDTSFKPKYPLIGRSSLDLGDVWSKRPKAYMSLAVSKFPNLFIMCGPGTVFANGSLLAGIEANGKYIVDCLAKMQSQDILSMEISQDAQDEYNEQQEAVMKDLVFTSHCSSWYKAGRPDAAPDALFAGSTLQFMEMLSVPRWEDWKFQYRHKNRFSFLGKGTSSIEARDGDRAFYLTEDMAKSPLRMSDYREPINDAVPINV